MKVVALLLFSTSTLQAFAASVTNWQFKGNMQWKNLTGSPINVDYAEATVSDDRLAILYDKQKRQWYMQFTYIAERQLTHSKNKTPEFFVRTRPNLGTGRFDSDYVIQRKASVFYNEPSKPQHLIMELQPVDLTYLKVGLQVGAGYFLTNGCKQVVANRQCIDLGEFRTYRFPGTDIAKAIETIERRNGLTITKAKTAAQRQDVHDQRKNDRKTAKILAWYHGDWAEFLPDGPLYGGCDAKRTITNNRFPNLNQKGRMMGKRHTGTLAISTENDSPDSLIFASAYPALRANKEKLLPVISTSQPKKVPLVTEDGKQYVRLKLSETIPGIPYKQIIDTDGKFLRLSSLDAKGNVVEPMYFMRCK